MIEGDRVTAILDGEVVSTAEMRLEPGPELGWITFLMRTGPDAGPTWAGVYRQRGGTLTWCGVWLPDGLQTRTDEPVTYYLHAMGRQAQ